MCLQEGSVLHVSTDLICVPPPAPPLSLHPPLLQPKEEEDVVEVDMYRRGSDGELSEDGGMSDEMKVKVQEEGCTEGVTEQGKYYDAEVTVPESDSDRETQVGVADVDTKNVTGEVTASDLICEPPECISLVSAAVSHEDNKQQGHVKH